jgi:Asp-tRNA(Asn)/Glu-tRNA(Gln) amidotransferase A subunit family amidase
MATSDTNTKGLRVGVARQYCRVGEAAVLDAFAAALRTLETLGCTLHDVVMLDVDEVFRVGDVMFQSEMAIWYENFARDYPSGVPDDVRRWLASNSLVSAMDYLRASQRRREMQMEFARAIRDVDVIALPSYFLGRRPFPANATMLIGGYPEIDGKAPGPNDPFRYSIPFNILGLPAISVPCLLSDQAAVGLQVVGRAWDEPTVLRAARAYEAATEWHSRQPPLP